LHLILTLNPNFLRNIKLLSCRNQLIFKGLLLNHPLLN